MKNMNGKNCLSVEPVGKSNDLNKNNRRQKIVEKVPSIRLRLSRSAECPECLANGILPLAEFAKIEDDSEKCKCVKCHPENFAQSDSVKDKDDGKENVVTSELDSTSSRSTLKIRARSWPLLVPPDDGKRDLKEPEIGLPSPVAQVRRLLWRHYYPEGGWGYVVVTCCILVHILNHGLQLAYGVLHGPIAAKFQVGINETGIFFVCAKTSDNFISM